MCLSCGVSNYSGAVFHITCHGFFKALLFLATGCLVGRCLLEQNYYILGGLNKVLPLPQIFILSGSLSVVGYPSLTGSYSKDYLIYSGFHSYLYDSYFLYLQATVGVVTTGRYSTRLLYLVFIRTKVRSHGYLYEVWRIKLRFNTLIHQNRRVVVNLSLILLAPRPQPMKIR